jgi:hypothetical protein
VLVAAVEGGGQNEGKEWNYIACNINSPYINKTGYTDKKDTNKIKTWPGMTLVTRC